MIPIAYANVIDGVENRVRFEEIYKTYYAKMFFRANRILRDAHEAEDAVQNAFIGVARNMKHISMFADEKDLFYYLMRAAENAAYACIRQTKHYANAFPWDDADTVSDDSFWEALCTKLDYEQVVHVIIALPPIYREVLYYHFLLEFTIPEVARILDIKLSTAKQRLVRGKKMLIREIQKEGELNCGTE